MKELTWDNTLSVDVDEIDDDHRKLVNLFNLLTHAIAEAEAPDYITAVLEELIACTVWHFRHEERLMLKHRFDGYAEHKEEHDGLIDSVQALRERFLRDGDQVSNDDVAALEQWLTGHILGLDMKLGAYLGKVM